MTELRIRALGAAQIAALVQLAQRIWRVHYADMISTAQIEYMLTQRYRPDLIGAQLADPAQRWLIAEEDGGLIGFAHVCRVDATSAKLDKLYVAPEQQRRGVGRALFAAAQDWARADGCGMLTVRANKANRQALAAYARYGFSMSGEVVEDIGGGFIMDDYQLEKPL